MRCPFEHNAPALACLGMAHEMKGGSVFQSPGSTATVACAEGGYLREHKSCRQTLVKDLGWTRLWLRWNMYPNSGCGDRYPNPKLVAMPILNLTRSDPQHCSFKARGPSPGRAQHCHRSCPPWSAGASHLGLSGWAYTCTPHRNWPRMDLIRRLLC